MARILVADDEPGSASSSPTRSRSTITRSSPRPTASEAAKLLDERGFDLVITDLKMPGLDGMALLRKVRAEQPEVEVIVMTAHGTVDNAVEAMKLGAFEYLQKPLSRPRRAAPARRSARSSAAGCAIASTAPSATPTPVGPAADLRRSGDEAGRRRDRQGRAHRGDRAAARRERHRQGGRRARDPRAEPARDQPFVAINCAALSETLLESELFGHEKGAFTGATERKRGRLELADGGTFFLDEVGELKPELQAKLLRVLQERRFERVGGSRTLEVDVRWIAATNRDLRAMIDARHVPRGPLSPARGVPDQAAAAARAPRRPAAARAGAARADRGATSSARVPSAHAGGRAAAARARAGAATCASSRTRSSAPRSSPTATRSTPSTCGSTTPRRPPPAARRGRRRVRPLAELEREAILHALEVVGGNRRKRRRAARHRRAHAVRQAQEVRRGLAIPDYLKQFPTQGDLAREQVRRRPFWLDVQDAIRARIAQLSQNGRRAFAAACAERLLKAHEDTTRFSAS